VYLGLRTDKEAAEVVAETPKGKAWKKSRKKTSTSK
jgi:hypothetical protein